jgi:protein involved in polysaccharide export with SLBB domain
MNSDNFATRLVCNKENAVRKLSLAMYACLLFVALFLIGCETTPKLTDEATLLQNSRPPDLSRLGAGDIIGISFPGAAELDGQYQIRTDGMITLPFPGESEILAGDLTTGELSSSIIEKFGPELAQREVNVAVIQTGNKVYVTGAVLQPQTIQYLRPMTVFEAIMESGGFVVNRAKIKEVRIIRNTDDRTETFILNLEPALRGVAITPFYLQPFDTVYVPQKSPSLFDPSL